MLIKFEYPPNIDELRKEFQIPYNAVMTYGDTIYNPNRMEIDKHLIVHEETHSRQQKDPVKWWKKYIKDKKFRLDQELEAYSNQLKSFSKDKKDQLKIILFLDRLANDLSSPMYGNIINKNEAIKLIKEYGRKLA